MSTKEIKDFKLLNGGQEHSSIPPVAPLSEGRVAFTVQIDRQVELLTSDGTVKIISGSGEESIKNGSGRNTIFGEPMNLCIEGDDIFVSDAQIETVQSLENLGKFYGAFPFILKTDRLRGTHLQGLIKGSKMCLHT